MKGTGDCWSTGGVFPFYMFLCLLIVDTYNLRGLFPAYVD